MTSLYKFLSIVSSTSHTFFFNRLFYSHLAFLAPDED